MIFFTADLHLKHENIIRLCDRPFGSIDEHDEVLLQNWNAVVSRRDEVYVLGDFEYHDNAEETSKVLRRLNGKKHLILGNPDRALASLEWIGIQ